MNMIEFSNNTLANSYNLLKKYKKQAIQITIVVMSIGIIYGLLSPYQYIASSSIMPPKQASSGMNLSNVLQSLGGGMGGLGSIAGIQQSNLSSVYSEVIVSNSVLNYIIDTLKLTKSPFYKNMGRYNLLKKLRTRINVLVDKSGIIFVSSTVNTGIIPGDKQKKDAAKLSADISNAAISGLDYVIRQRNNSVSGKTKDFIGKEMESYNKQLDSIQNLLEEFRQKNKILELEEQTKAIVLQANTIAVELAKAEVELNLGKSLYSENSQNYKMLKQSYDVLKSQYDKIQAGGITQNDKFSIPLNEFPTLIRTYTNFIRDQKLYEQILIYLRTNYYQEAIQEKRDVPQIDVLDWAMVPIEKDAPNYKLLFIVFSLLDIAVIFLYILYKANRTEKIKT
jgi:uncharacterized protein involved in exopolysaccharide biosynthesis